MVPCTTAAPKATSPVPNNEAVGTKNAHYSPPGDGPFDCKNCVHFQPWGGRMKDHHHQLKHAGTCDHPEVQKDADAGEIRKDAQGKPIVSAGGCCSYQR